MTRALLVLVGLLTAAPAFAQEERGCSWQDLTVVERQVAETTKATLRRDWLDLELGVGRMIALEACGELVGLVWQGEGRVVVGDPGAERGHILHNLYDNLPGENDLETVILVGSDGAVDELLAQSTAPAGTTAEGPWGEAPVPFALREVAERRLSAFDPKRQSGFDIHPPGEVLWAPSPEAGGLFLDLQLIGMKRQRRSGIEVTSQWLAYHRTTGAGVLPQNPILWRRRSVGSARELLLADLPTEQTMAAVGSPFAEERTDRPWDLQAANVSLLVEPTFGLDKDLSSIDVVTTLTLQSLEPQSELTLSLLEGRRRTFSPSWGPADLKGVGTVHGEETEAVRWSRVGNRVFVHFDQEIAPEEIVTLRLRHKGALVEPSGSTAITPLAGFDWYPRTPGHDRHDFELIASAPRFWRVAATGLQIEEQDDGKQRRIVSRSKRPVERGDVYIVDADPTAHAPPREGLPLVRVYRSPSSPVGSLKGVADDVWAWLERLEGLMGPFPFDEVEIVERGVNTTGLTSAGVIPIARLDAPPDTSVTSISGTRTLIGALARQWLVANMGARSDHDVWLEEGLSMWAESFALVDGNKQGRSVALPAMSWKEWRDALLRVESSGPTTSDWPVGALWLGQSSGWGYANQRHRGPLVAQLLRMMLDDKVTRELLGQMTKTYSGQNVTTASFVHQAQRISGQDLRRFFYGWVYATPQQPVARIEWSTNEVAPGQWELVIDGHIDDGRPAAAPMPMVAPFFLSMKVDGQPAGQRIFLTEEPNVVKLEGIPAEPKGLRVLAQKVFPGTIDFKKKK